MRNLLKLIKNLSFLLCFGFGLNYMVVPVMAQSIVPPVIEEEAPDEEEIGGWSTLDKKTQETIAKNQARNAAAGQSDEARAIYDAQQQRYDQRDASKEKYADTLNAGDERIRNMEALTEQAKEDLAEAQSNAPKMCSADEIGGNVFLLIACKATTTLADLRVIAYIISGFGMVALAYAAIFGKMNWKHLANIGIGLFLLSMMTPFIEYFTTGKDNTLRFGKYLPAGFSDIQGSDGQVTDCEDLDKNSTFCNQILPEVTVTGKKQKWSLKDLKGSITAGLDAVRNASDMYKAAKSTVSNVKSAVSNMTAQIKSGGGGLDGIINAAGAVANATGTIVNSGQVLANNIATNAGNLSNNIRDAGSTNAAREARAEAQETLDKLTKKCNAGNCSEQEKKYMEQMEETVNNNKTGVNKWLENDGAGGGSTILSGINKVGNIANNASNSVKNVANAANEGQSIGGDGALGKILGVGFGVGTAVTEGMDTAEQSKQNGMFDFRSDATKREEQAKAEEEAFKKTSGYVKNTQTTADGKKVETLGDGSVRTTSKDGKTVTTVNKDGTTTTTKDGTTVVKSPDGSRTVTDSAGNKVTYDAKGNKVKTELVNEYNRATAESVKEALNGKKEEEKSETKPKESSSKLSKIIEGLKKQCGGNAVCEQCAASVKSEDPAKATQEAQACLDKHNAKVKEDKAKTTQQTTSKTETAEATCTPQQCFMSAEGSDAKLTACCKKKGFKMPSGNDKCATLKEERQRAIDNYKACNQKPGRDCNSESEKAAELAQQYKKECPNG